MADVPKNVAASAPALALPLDRRGKAEEERELVRLAQKGSEPAFEELVRRHQQRVFALVARILRQHEDIEDVVQQVFMKAYVSLRRFDQRAALSTWLYKIAVNECWDYLRKKKVRPLMYEADLSDEQVTRLEATGTLAREAVTAADGPDRRTESKEIVARMMEKLPDQDRQLLVLKEIEGFSVQELAQILELNVNTVKVRLFRARGRLMDLYRRRLGPNVPAPRERKEKE